MKQIKKYKGSYNFLKLNKLKNYGLSLPNVEARLRMERLNQKLISASLGGEEEVVTSSQELWVRGRRWSKTGGEHYITQSLVIHIVVLYWYWPTLPPRVPPARHSPREGWGVTSWPGHTSHSGHRDQNTRNDPIIKTRPQIAEQGSSIKLQITGSLGSS